MSPSRSVVSLAFLAGSLHLFAWQAPAPCLDRPVAERPYTRVHLFDIVRSQTAVRAEYLIRTCGVKVTFNAELESDLKEAGAEESVIAAVRDVAPKPATGPVQGDIRVNPKDGLRYAYIPPGTFRMGCSPEDRACDGSEKPAHDVRISKGFWMGQTDVTVEAYKRYARAAGKSMPAEPNEQGQKVNPNWSIESVPMTRVSWTEARDYCEWSGMRLPTEAQWEYAARAGTTGPQYGDLNEIAWWAGNSGDKTIDADDIWKTDRKNYSKRIVENGNRPHGVGLKRANAFQLYDMLGNVWQWTADWYKGPYESGNLEVDPQGPPGGEFRVLRGGSWYNDSNGIRVSFRSRNRPSARFGNDGGFRCSGEIRVP